METTRRAPLDYIELTGQKPLDDARENGIRGIRFNNGAGLAPEVIVASTQGESTEDGAYQEAVALLAHK